MATEEWRKARCGGFTLYGTRCAISGHRSGWRVASGPDEEPQHDYWVVGSALHYSFPSIFDPGSGSRTIYQIGPVVEDADPAEHAAILEAIERWEASMRKAPSSVDFPLRDASGRGLFESSGSAS
ncbi:MAG: hypothetical protein ACLQG3_11350 [Terracidiphilus sp.]